MIAAIKRVSAKRILLCCMAASVFMLSAAGRSAASDLSLAGAGSSESPGVQAQEPLLPPAETEAEILPHDEMLTVLGSHSTLTNEQVAGEYEWVKTNLQGEYMPYVIDHAEGNPNVIHFLYVRAHGGASPEEFSYTDEERQKSLPLLGSDVHGLVPLLMQWDWRWGFDHYGGGPAGLTACAPTCMAMIGFGLTGDESITPRSLSVRSEQTGYWVNGSGTSWDFVTNAFPDGRVSGWRINPDADSVRSELSAGHPVLINVGIGKFAAVGHFMVISGTDADGNFILNDPNNIDNCTRTWPWEDLAGEVTAAWSYALNG